MKKGEGYIGTSKIEVSGVNHEVIPSAPESWSTSYKCYKFSFINQSPCTVIINGDAEIFLDENQGFEMSFPDKRIESFIIVEEGVSYQFIAGYGA